MRDRLVARGIKRHQEAEAAEKRRQAQTPTLTLTLTLTPTLTASFAGSTHGPSTAYMHSA